MFKSTYHRVRAPVQGDPTGDRYSIPYFVNPRLNYVMQVRSGVWGWLLCRFSDCWELLHQLPGAHLPGSAHGGNACISRPFLASFR